MRLLELEAALVPRDGLRAGMAIEVSLVGEGVRKVEWHSAPIVAVWRDGGFRVLVEDKKHSFNPLWVEDYAAPGSKQGRKERGTDWRWPGLAASARGRRGEMEASAAPAAPRGERAAAKRARSARSFVDGRGGAESDDDDESGSRRSSSGSAASGRSESPPGYEGAPPEMGQRVEVLRKRKWVAAEVTRLFRGGSFEAQELEGGDRGKHTLDDHGSSWRQAGQAEPTGRGRRREA